MTTNNNIYNIELKHTTHNALCEGGEFDLSKWKYSAIEQDKERERERETSLHANIIGKHIQSRPSNWVCCFGCCHCNVRPFATRTVWCLIRFTSSDLRFMLQPAQTHTHTHRHIVYAQSILSTMIMMMEMKCLWRFTENEITNAPFMVHKWQPLKCTNIVATANI